MICKYLSGLKIPNCLASERSMYPSVYELRTFCQNDPEKCLIYQGKDAAGTVPAKILLKKRKSMRKEAADDAVSY